ncbi:MAG TPA: STN domain-containing protein, partial [Pseudobacter sp.]|nr:STN domain-containing protein [Pseudobacter sp.]
MRLTLVSFLFLGLCLHISAKSNSQTITYSGKKVSLKEVFSAIEKQTGYVVFYDGAVLRNADLVSIRAEGMPLETFLTAVLKEQSFDYSIQKKTIVISPRK